jgi:branched-chain amino acid transport system permease protein
MSRRITVALALLGALVLLALPALFGNGYQLTLVTTALIWVVLVIGLQIIFGYGGLLSVAHGGLFGFAAYVTAVLNVKHDMPVLQSGALAIVATTLLSAVIGLIAVRASGMSFAVLTLAFGAILYELFLNATDITGGPLGVVGIDPLPEWANSVGLDITPAVETYITVAFVAVVALALLYWFVRSEFGRALVCTREDETLAASYGINVRQTRRWAFLISGAFAGLAGVLFSHYYQFIAPESFTFLAAFQAIVMVVAGGAGLFLGTIVGAITLSLLPELLRDVSEYQQVTYGLILFLAIRFLPSGVVGWARDRIDERRLVAGREL